MDGELNDMSESDPFEGYEPIPGLEHMGRAIVDANGMPSGSPANFEASRGKGAYVPTEEDRSAMIAMIAAETLTVGAIPEDHPWAADAHD